MTEYYTSTASHSKFSEDLAFRELSRPYGDENAQVKPAGAEQMVAQTRNPVITPQCLVNLAVDVPKGECEARRKRMEHDDGDLLAPHASDDKAHRLQKGQIVMMRYGGTGFNTNMNADSQMTAVGALNGESTNTKWCMPGVVQTMSDPSNLMDNQAQATVTVHGPQTVANYGLDRINAGDGLILTPYAPLVQLGKDGGKNGDKRMGPMIKGPPGYHPETVQWGVMKMHGTTVSGFIRRCKEKFRTIIGTKEFMAKASARAVTVDGLYTLMTTELDNMFSSSLMVAPDHPIRGYMIVWAMKRWSNVLKLERPGGSASLGMHIRLALMARWRACVETEELYAKRGEEYGTPLPHDGDQEDIYFNSLKRSHSTLNGDYMRQLIGIHSDAPVSGAAPRKITPEGLLEAETRMSMHEDEILEQFVARIRAHFDTFKLGTALQSADKGMAVDVFVGK